MRFGTHVGARGCPTSRANLSKAARQLSTGPTEAMRADVAALKEAGARTLIVLLQAPWGKKTFERMGRFAEAAMRP